MENIESLREAYESPNSRKEQRNFIASVLLDAVSESLAEDNSGNRSKEIQWGNVDKARKYLLKKPIAHLYFVLLDINIDAALGRLQKNGEKWTGNVGIRLSLKLKESHSNNAPCISLVNPAHGPAQLGFFMCRGQGKAEHIAAKSTALALSWGPHRPHEDRVWVGKPERVPAGHWPVSRPQVVEFVVKAGSWGAVRLGELLGENRPQNRPPGAHKSTK